MSQKEDTLVRSVGRGAFTPPCSRRSAARESVEQRLRLVTSVRTVRAAGKCLELLSRFVPAAEANETERAVITRLRSKTTVRRRYEVTVPRLERTRRIALREVKPMRFSEQGRIRVRRRRCCG